MASLEARARGDVRASDAERDSCARALRHHYAAGRLDATELEERLERSTRARTRGELKALLRDLPRSRRRGGSPFSRAALRVHGGVFVAVNGGLAGVWAATGEGQYWPGGVLAPWAVLLGWHVASVWVARRGARLTVRGGGRRALRR